MPQEFSPKDEILHKLRLWWVLVICMILGGLVGYVFSHLQPAIYQAKATLFAAIDYQSITNVRLSEYDEDMTINSVQSVMLSNDVIRSVIMEVAESGYSLDYATFMQQKSIYRKFSDYDLYYRDPDPEKAQLIVNTWATIGVRTFKEYQEAGMLPLYVNVLPGNLASLPTSPAYQKMNSHVLGGALLGMLLGIMLTSARNVAWVKKSPGQHR